MKKKIIIKIILSLLVILMQINYIFPQSSKIGSLSGVITGIDTKAPLPFANVSISGTNNGGVADIKGRFLIRNIAVGKQKVKISYLGYKTKTIDVVIMPDKTTELNVALEITSIKGKEVVITAQRMGQQSAINEQINSVNIKNVVSADRLQENPDANVAEALGRLPGISLIEQGGEGTAIMVRGMSPQYTQILVDGVPIPSIFSLGNISQYALKGIEVFKTITPDMEGDATAGVVNMKMGEAPSGLKYDLMLQGGYNNLNNYFKNYRLVGGFSDRLFQNNLGVRINLAKESVNRSTQSLNAIYQLETVPPLGQLAPLFVNNINLNDVSIINYRTSGSVVLDYRLSSVSKLLFSNLFANSDQNYTDVIKSYNLTNGDAIYNINYVPHTESKSYFGTLKGEHQFQFFELDEGVSFAQTHNYTPDSRSETFQSNSGVLKQYGSQAVESLPLNQILLGTTDELSSTTLNNFYLYNMGRSASDNMEKLIDSYINAKIPYHFGDFVSGYIKLGAEYKNITYYSNSYSGIFESYLFMLGPYAKESLPWVGDITGGGISDGKGITMNGLGGPQVNFLNGKYNFGWYPNIDRLNQIFDWWNNLSNYYSYVNPKATPPAFTPYGGLGFTPNWQAIEDGTQRTNEFYYAGYIMGE
ncbi:MAG: TonB-dependent receptor, partial [Ignavibacteriaceae bacterium]